MRSTLLALFAQLFAGLAFAQHPEIIALQHMEATGNRLIDRALERYDRSDYDSANGLFLQALDAGQFGKNDYLYFSNSLRSAGKTALAREFLAEYLRVNHLQFGTVPTLANNVEKLDTLLRPSIRPVANSKNLFSVHAYNGRIYGSKEGKIYSHQYACAGELSEERLNFGQNSIVAHTSVAYFNDGFSAVLTQSNSLHGGASLYLAHRDEDGWSLSKKPLFEDIEGNFCSPYFDEMQNILYFSSNMAGGQGGYDLYMSFYRSGRFTDPVNLGATVNTARHDLAPYKSGEWLYFSSNGYPSKGGFDLYRYKAVDDFTQLVLGARNLNSQADEFGLVQLSGEEFLVQRHTEESSVLLHFSSPQQLNEFSGSVTSSTGQVISETPIYVLVEDAGTPSFHLVDPYGHFNFVLDHHWTRARIHVMAEGYHSQEQQILAGQEISVQLVPIRVVEITKVVDQGSDQEGLKLIPPDGNPVEQMGDPDPDFQTTGAVKPESEVYYVIVGSARSYSSAYKIWNQWVEEFTDLAIIEFGPELYRVGFSSGKDEREAITALKNTIGIKPDAWIIRPGTY